MKSILFFLLCTAQVALSQYASNPDNLNFEAIQNKMDLLIFETNIYIAQNSKCLSGLYKDLEKGKRISTFGNFDCGSRSPLAALNEADQELLQHINLQYPAYFSSINQTTRVVEQLQQLLKNQQLDHSKLEGLLRQFEASAQEFKLQSDIQSKNQQTKTLEQLPQALKAYILTERQFIQSNKYFLRASFRGNFPTKELQANIARTDSLSRLIETAARKDKKLTQILGQIAANQQIKNDFLQQVAYDKLLDCNYRNEFYFQLHNYFNNGLIPALKVHYSASYGLTAIYQPFNNMKHQQVAAPQFKNQVLISGQLDASKISLNKEQYKFLADHINLINQSIQANNLNASVLYQLDQELPAKRAVPSYKLSLKLKKDFSFLALQLSCSKLIKRTSAAYQLIAQQSLALATMLNDCNTSYDLINTEFSQNNITPSNHEQLVAWLDVFKEQLHNAAQQIKLINQNLGISFKNTSKNSPESTCSKDLLSYCQTLKEVLRHVENKTNITAEIALDDQQKASAYHSKLIEQTDHYLTKIDKTEYFDVYSLHRIYKELIQQGEQLQEKYKYLQENARVPFKKGCCQGYYSVLNSYNGTLLYFNEFSRMSAQNSQQAIFNHLLVYETIILP